MTNDKQEQPASMWLSVQAAASELEVTTRTIYRFINDGKLAAYRIGRVYRIRRTDLDGFLLRAALQPGDLDHLVDDGRSGRSDLDRDDQTSYETANHKSPNHDGAPDTSPTSEVRTTN